MTRTSLLLLLVALPATARAQGVATATPLIQSSGSFFALVVPDLQASTRWYTEKLGLTITMQAPPSDRYTVTVLKGGGLTVELIQNDDAVPVSKVAPSTGRAFPLHGIVKVGLVVKDFEQTMERIKVRKVDIAIGPWPKRPDQPAQVIIKDNAGNLIQIFGP